MRAQRADKREPELDVLRAAHTRSARLFDCDRVDGAHLLLFGDGA
jgi:hypothetical protein